MSEPARYKIPRSVLVVIHTPDLQVLMMERAGWKDFWQSVTGSVARGALPLRNPGSSISAKVFSVASP